MPAPAPRFELRHEPVGDLRAHAAISSAFAASVVLDVIEDGERCCLVERRLGTPFHKNYDALESPTDWLRLFDVTTWVLVTAYEGEHLVGGAIGARSTAGVDMLEGRDDLVVLWDLRVGPTSRGHGVGSALFRAVETWGRRHACTELKVETQNVNVAACRLYEAQGCRLAQMVRGAYPEVPDEIQLIWRKRLTD